MMIRVCENKWANRVSARLSDVDTYLDNLQSSGFSHLKIFNNGLDWANLRVELNLSRIITAHRSTPLTLTRRTPLQTFSPKKAEGILSSKPVWNLLSFLKRWINFYSFLMCHSDSLDRDLRQIHVCFQPYMTIFCALHIEGQFYSFEFQNHKAQNWIILCW